MGPIFLRLAIANSRLLTMTDDTVSFRWKDYRHESRRKVMTLAAGEFMRRFLLHVLPPGFHRIRHFGFLANSHRTARLDLCRRLLARPGADHEGRRGAEPRPPLVECRIADAMPAAQFGGAQPRLVLLQDADDLLVAEPALAHAPVSPSLATD